MILPLGILLAQPSQGPISDSAQRALASEVILATEPDQPPQTKPSPWALAALVAGDAADIASTAYMLHHSIPEGNAKIMGSTLPRIVATKAAGTLVKWWLIRQMAKRSPLAADLAGYGSAAYNAYITKHNLDLAAQAKRRRNL